MSYHADLQWWIILVAQLIFYQNAEAGLSQDRDRVYITYDLNTDHCTKLSVNSGLEARDAANKACKDAFIALDKFEGNACNGWRRPRCRQLQLPDYDYFQCSCSISYCNELGIRTDVVNAFRDCAWKVYAEEIFNGGQAPPPSIIFQRESQKIYDRAVQKARFRKNAPSTSEAGTSQVSGLSFPPGFSGNPVAWPSAVRGPFVCKVCGRSYTALQTLRYHARAHKTNLRCKLCNSTYTSRGNLHQHMRYQHPELVMEESDTSIIVEQEPGGSFVCEICGRGYQHAHNFAAHKIVHIEDVRCTLCNTPFSSKANRRKHMELFHPAIAATEVPQRASLDKAFRCNECEARFASNKTLSQHKAVHRGETTCQYCNKTFSRKTLLNTHKKTCPS